MPVRKMKEFMDSSGVAYECIEHAPAYTAMETAEFAHVPGRDLAKTVMVKIDGRMAMAVLPATHHLDLELLRQVAGARSAELANEREFNDLFPDCEHGAMPPFGNLYNMQVLVSDALAEDEYIAFNAGTHDELVRLPYREYERLVRPRVAPISHRVAAAIG